MATITEQIIEFTDKVRPYLQRDGGDFEFVRFSDGIVYIKMLGACSMCASSAITIDSIEKMMMEEIPGIIAVRQD